MRALLGAGWQDRKGLALHRRVLQGRFHRRANTVPGPRPRSPKDVSYYACVPPARARLASATTSLSLVKKRIACHAESAYIIILQKASFMWERKICPFTLGILGNRINMKRE